MPRLAPSKTADMLTWARWWIDQGWSVFPLVPRDKEPVTQNGFKDATQDIEQCKLWWGRNPEYNLGGVPPEDMFVVDIDAPTDIKFPDTWEHSTSTDVKRHLLYVQNPTNPIPHGQKVWPNIDTRCHGKGYVVLPPSVHPNGAVYGLVAQVPPRMFPGDIKPVRAARKPRESKADVEHRDVIEALRYEGVDGTGRDDTMTKLAGLFARYMPNRDVFAETLAAINRGWVDQLDDSAMNKKFGMWDTHQANLKAKEDKELNDESIGWLYEAGGTGYASRVEKSDGTFTVVEFSDFRLTTRGVVIEPERRLFIVDIHKSDGEVIEGQVLDTDTLSSPTKVRTWFANRGAVLYDNRIDKKQAPGLRLLKLMQSQNPSELKSTDYYGFNVESGTFITETVEITPDGATQPYSAVFPTANTSKHNPIHYGFELDAETTLDALRRTLSLNTPLEMAKLGAWVVMTLLKGQYEGKLPGLMTSAFSGTGKSTLYEIITGWLGFPQAGGKLTPAVFRNLLSHSANTAVWLDDFKLDDAHITTIRAALTTGQESKMEPRGNSGQFEVSVFPLRGAVIMSDEGNTMLKEKANRDRFLEINLSTGFRTGDGEALKQLRVSRGAGTLVSILFKHRHHLDALPGLFDHCVDRPSRWRAMLLVGARILSDVLGEPKWADMVTAWCAGIDGERQNNASVLIHDILPWMWATADHPTRWGSTASVTSIYHAVWYEVDTRTYWINVGRLSRVWLDRRNLSPRQQQFGTEEAIRTELRACGQSGKGRQCGPDKLRYVQLPAEYSAIVYGIAEVAMHDEEGS